MINQNTKYPVVRFSEMFLEPPRNGVYKSKSYIGKGVNLIRMGDLFSNDIIDSKLDSFQKIELDKSEKDRFSLKNNDLVFSRTSVKAEGVGKCSIIRMNDETDLAFDSNMIRVRLSPDITDPRYYYYYFQSSQGRNSIHSIAGGVAVTAIKGSDLKKINVPFPPLKIQKKLASILSAYDDLIENNTRRIRILEEMAQAIYREWFIEFRLPGVKLRKTTPEEKKAIGKDVIPEGWEVVKIGDLIEKIPRRKKIKKQEYQEKGIYPVVDQGREFIGGYTNEGAAVNDNPLPVIVFGDHTRIVKYIDFPFACGADGTQLLYPNNKRMPITLFYYAINNIDLKDYAYSRHFKFLKEKTTILPDEFISNEFNSIVEPIREKIRILRTQINNLRQTRDLLLPKLVSGEVEV